MVILVPLFAVLGWAGLFIHNVADLPGQTLLSPESFLPLLLTAALVALWLTAWRPVAAWGLLVLGILNLIGAVLTVLPLPALPFDPAQTPFHYGFHVLYGATQLPVVIAAAVWLRRRSRTDDNGNAG
ncbi:hypothetical protein J2M53_06360 [Arthrobacter sp. zg-ZUI100]|uniref:hypothetical protein n=1 Tax=Arthrobacter jiangjiafuii TaxID=2817475 RepID=UPI001AEDB078|nr:hypothetical protein [Arthrobacter jiangjiafuii]MBP3035877.1 hypothetical protein [Arthrobacter jiangjiafuii]